MIERDTVDCVEQHEVVLVWVIVAMPGNHVQRRTRHGCRPHVAGKLGNDLGGAWMFFEPRDGRQEIARIGEPVGANRAQLGEP